MEKIQFFHWFIALAWKSKKNQKITDLVNDSKEDT